ncbi:MAG: hypothetical protein BWZ10_03091 [candidate division BRC1 bacterium ADurb.BinA364]|nr:MAG: hypothetical protein BWZ10_03091 [candidate division BRC1 bacterium ADurb.BinA364]
MLAGGYRAVSFCGAPATAAILCGLAWTLLRAPRTMIEAMRDEAFLTIALVGALFAAHSDETDYLLIGLPFLAIFLARALPRKAWLAAIALSVLHGIVTLDLVGGPSGQRRFEPRLTLGVLPSDAWLRVRDLRLRAAFGELAAKAQSPYLLINEMQSLDFAHSALHETPLELGRDSMSAKQYENKAFFIVPALSREAIGNALELGWRVGFFDASRGQIAAKAGFDPESAGAQAIDSAALARMPDWPIKKR